MKLNIRSKIYKTKWYNYNLCVISFLKPYVFKTLRKYSLNTIISILNLHEDYELI